MGRRKNPKRGKPSGGARKTSPPARTEPSPAPAHRAPTQAEELFEPDPLFRLEFERTSGADAVLPFRWSLTPAGAEKLADPEYVHPHLFVFATQEVPGMSSHVEVFRRLIPLKQGNQVHHLRFNRPGKFNLRAFLVYARRGLEALEIRYMGGGGGYLYEQRSSTITYAQPLFSGYNGMVYEGAILYDAVGSVQRVPIEIDPEHFATPIPETLWTKWVNYWHAGPPADECQYRRRSLLAIPKIGLVLIVDVLYLVWLTLASMVKVCLALLALLLGCRLEAIEIDWAYDGSFSVASNDPNSYYTLKDENGKDREHLYQSVLRAPLSYILYSALALIWYSLPMAIFVGVSVLLGTLTLVHLLMWLGDEWKKRLDAVAEPAEDEQTVLLRERNLRAEQFTQLISTHDGVNQVVKGVDLSFRGLPVQDRTIRVRFLDFKARVCRQFAQR